MAEIYIAKQGAAVDFDGETIVLKKGSTRVEEGHALLKRYPDLFERADQGAHFKVSTARAEPTAPRTRKAKADAAPTQGDGSGAQP